jgi:hypothetical protein
MFSEELWRPAAYSGSDATILGIDRHGQLANRPVKIVKLPDGHLPVALGTDAAFGLFHPDSSVLLADGSRSRVAALISSGSTVADTRFEMVRVDERAERREALDFRGLWDSLCRRCFCTSDDTLLISELRLPSSGFPETSISRKEKEGWWSVARSDLEEAFNALGVTQRRVLICALFSSGQDENPSYIFLPNEAYHAMNVRLWSGPSCFNFESLQYSYRISVIIGRAPNGPIQLGKTHFVWPNVMDSFQLSWEDRSWTPVVNGFILVGD